MGDESAQREVSSIMSFTGRQLFGYLEEKTEPEIPM